RSSHADAFLRRRDPGVASPRDAGRPLAAKEAGARRSRRIAVRQRDVARELEGAPPHGAAGGGRRTAGAEEPRAARGERAPRQDRARAVAAAPGRGAGEGGAGATRVRATGRSPLQVRVTDAAADGQSTELGGPRGAPQRGR